MRRSLVLFGVGALVVAGAVGVPSSVANAAANSISDVLDINDSNVWSVSTAGASSSLAVSSTPFGSFPRSGGSYVIMSTGNATDVLGGSPDSFLSTNLGSGNGADGNDMAQVSLELTPAAGATCLAVDFQFLSEEYPEYVGSEYNDIFTAELGESHFEMTGSQVIAPNNFAYDSDGNFISINTVLGFHDATGTGMDGTTDPLVAVSPIETDVNTGRATVIFSIQDIGDSIYDSAALLDNFRWLYGDNCERTVASLADSDGDGLADEWETNGIDYDGDGVVEVDLPALGADPERADIFLEIDWMEKPPTCLLILCWGAKNFEPDRAALSDVVNAFAAAPYSNPNGSTGITLHIDAGSLSPGANLGGGNAVPWVSDLGSTSGGVYNWAAFESLKSANFDSLRRDVFHYVVYADHYGGSTSSGISRGIPGADLIVSDGPWSGGFTRIQERGTLMHELGHNLDLKHGGVDHTTYQNNPSYRSVMNYLYQLVGLSPGARLDYSRGTPFDDWANIRFDGGSIGDLGDSAPILTTEDDIELTPEIANELDVAAVDGDGSIEILGPNVFGAGMTGQVVKARVHNPGSSAQAYSISGSVAGENIPTVEVSVDATSEQDVAVVFDASNLPAGDAPIILRLSSTTLGDDIDEDAASLQGLNLEDDVVRDSLAADLVAAAASDAPPASSVLETVSALIEDDTEPQPTPTPTPTPTTTPSPTPSASPTQPSATQLIRLSTTTVEQGGKLVVSGTGFAPNTSIELWLHSTPVLLAQTDVGATGEFAKEITIPPTTAPGAHKVVVSTSNGDVAVNLEVRTVSAAALGATGGTFSPWWVVGGLGALVVGAVLILWRRKRA